MSEVLDMFRSYLEQQLEFGEEEILLTSRSKSECLSALEERVRKCTRCPLSKTRNRVVFGEGSVDSSVAFIGEAPGRAENEQGRPFVGSAGQLLSKAIEALGLRREDVYIANIVKCRPPNNRVPREAEIASCLPYLLEQLSIVAPTAVGLLGAVAAQSILKMDSPVFKLRRKVFTHSEMKLVPTYHPAALLRNPDLKSHFWKDMRLIRSIHEGVKSFTEYGRKEDTSLA